MFEASNRGLNTQGCWNWQTSRPQTPVFLTCGFKSRPLHQNEKQTLAVCFLFWKGFGT